MMPHGFLGGGQGQGAPPPMDNAQAPDTTASMHLSEPVWSGGGARSSQGKIDLLRQSLLELFGQYVPAAPPHTVPAQAATASSAQPLEHENGNRAEAGVNGGSLSEDGVVESYNSEDESEDSTSSEDEIEGVGLHEEGNAPPDGLYPEAGGNGLGYDAPGGLGPDEEDPQALVDRIIQIGSLVHAPFEMGPAQGPPLDIFTQLAFLSYRAGSVWNRDCIDDLIMRLTAGPQPGDEEHEEGWQAGVEDTVAAIPAGAAIPALAASMYGGADGEQAGPSQNKTSKTGNVAHSHRHKRHNPMIRARGFTSSRSSTPLLLTQIQRGKLKPRLGPPPNPVWVLPG
eukprot:gene27627-7264_t